MNNYTLYHYSKPKPTLPELILVGTLLLAIGGLLGFYAGMYAVEHYIKAVEPINGVEVGQ